jgi:hypothetical protein
MAKAKGTSDSGPHRIRSGRSKRTGQGNSTNTRYTNKHKKRSAGKTRYRGQGR